MSHLDRLLVKSFIGPFLLTFMMAWFVLLMQFLWFFLEKIADKGLDFSVILELIFYRSVGLIPLALPLAALISSVMVIGGLAERYEWTAFQSAGVSLHRLLRPLAILGLLFVGASYCTADYLIPAANLRFYERLAAVYQKKPDLSLDTGVFNEDLDRFVLYAAGRSPDEGHLQDIILYDQQKSIGQINQITAKEGRFSTQGKDANQLFLILREGEHYQEETQGRENSTFVRTRFSSYTLSFDLSQFDLKEGKQFSGGSHHALLTTSQLQTAADSVANIISAQDTIIKNRLNQYAAVLNNAPTISKGYGKNPTTQVGQRVLSSARSINRKKAAETKLLLQKRSVNQELYSKYLYEKHAKLGLAVVCFLFVLVGGATGAIVRKGGFGFPLLLSIASFITYILLLEFCRRLAKTLILAAPAAGWVPVIILAMIAGGLIWRAGRWA